MFTKRIIVYNTASQLVGKIIGAATSFAVAFFLAKSLGADGYGDFTKITTFVVPFYLIADFGLNAIMLQKQDASIWWNRLLGLRMVGSAILMFLAVSILAFLPQGNNQGYTNAVRLGIILFAPSIFFQSIITTANAFFQKRLRYDVATAALAAGSLVTVVFLFVFRMTVTASILAQLAGIAATAAAALYGVKKFTQPLRPAFSRESLTQLLVPSLPLGITLLFNLIYFRADSFVLTLSRSTADVGIYGLAYKVFEVALVIPTFFMNAVYPLMLKHQNYELRIMNYEFKKIFQKSLLFMILTSVFMIPVFWFAAPLVSFIKQDFSASVPALRVLSLGLPFFFVSSLVMWTLITLKKQIILMAVYGASMVVNIILNMWFVPEHGYMAAAWITVGSEGLVLLLSGIALMREFKV
ncbi:oligosaccharide flippase family protein [Candidatus Gottesmanbacteria bacterium]|nr:oligosaccharide flippase family protein [Candidatus Gottesmanbacteria bacterium]